MKRISKLLIACILCAIMALGSLASAFAISAKPYKDVKYNYYTYLGDSIPFGYGLASQEVSSDPYSIGVRVDGCYPDLVAKVLQKNNKKVVIQPAACSGSRVCDYRIIFERGMGYENPYDCDYDWYDQRKPERTERLRSMGPDVCKWLAESDLVTFQCGLNDITSCLVRAAYATGIIDINAIQSLDSFEDVLGYLSFAFGNLKNDPVIIDNFVTTFAKELVQLRQNMRAVVRELEEAAPKDADLLIVGYNKAVQGLRVIPGTDRSFLFDLVDEVLMSFNSYYKTLTKQYDNMYFVDAPDAPVFFPEGTTVFDMLKDTDNLLLGVHPSEKGHQYIAKKVLNKLEEINS